MNTPQRRPVASDAPQERETAGKDREPATARDTGLDADPKRRKFYQRYNREAGYWDALYERGEDELTAYAHHYLLRKKVIQRMLDRLPAAAGREALDAGCGPGAYIPELLRRGYRVTAVDQAEGMLEKARSRVPPLAQERVSLEQASIDALPFGDGRFDLVLNVGVLMYLSRDGDAVKELFRVTRPGGTLILTVDNRRNLADFIDLPARLRGMVKKVFRRRRRGQASGASVPSGNAGAEPAAHCYGPGELAALLQRAGFVVDERTSVGFTPLLFNGRRILSDRMDIRLGRLLAFLRWLPLVRLGGYILVYRCHRPATASGDA